MKNDNDIIQRYYFGDNFGDKEHIFRQALKVNVSDEFYSAGGIPLESDGKCQYLAHGGEHSLIISATGGGKTVSIVEPAVHNCIRAGESILAVDPKGDLYEHSYADLRKYDYNVQVINFRNLLNGLAYNPLMLPYKYWQSDDPHERDLALKMLEDMRHSLFMVNCSQKDPFWDEACGDMFVGLALALFEHAEHPEQVTLANIYSMMSTGKTKRNGNHHSNAYIKLFFEESIDKYSVAYSSFASYLSASAGETLGSMEAVFFQKMRMLYSSELLVDMLSHNDIDISEMARKKTALFIIVPDESKNYHPLVSIIVSQVYQQLVRIAQNEYKGTLPYRVNFILEEFGNLSINNASSMISAARSRNIRFMLVVQTERQLRSMFGEDEAHTIKTNCMNWIFLYTRELGFLQELSELIGKKMCNINNHYYLLPLMSVSQLQNMELGKALVFYGRNRAIVTDLAPVWEYQYNSQGREVEYPRRQLRPIKQFQIIDFVERKIRDRELFFSKPIEEIIAYNAKELANLDIKEE